ncbi:xanthine dehydrogenase family protein molybdopterin-binding subunit [Ferrimicrobium sp.]|uniref:xanthine dehydrogenase family protein molybdopterin-binding subunit n=1 Tax=Ferrimicrobium sp. TaxID=2926050 RepID=UPI0026071C6C|nr:xanthine dehydrogenase family protein molybdopterin-binding subunit [Ferrimicrobium sp.]
MGTELSRGGIGALRSRQEDVELLSGTRRFVDDLVFPGTAFMRVVRSPVASGQLEPLDLAEVRRMPGVILAADAVSDPDLRIVVPAPIVAGADVVPKGIPTLAAGRVRFVGEPVAVIVATSRRAAEDAADLVYPVIETDAGVYTLDDAMARRRLVHDDLSDNILARWSSEVGGVDTALRMAHRLVSVELSLPRLVAVPMEPRGCVATADPSTGRLTLYASAQDPHRPKQQLAAALNLSPADVRVVVPAVGGAFGSKGAIAPEHVLAVLLSKRLGCPVKWIEDRSENFLGAYQGRGMQAKVTMGFDPDASLTVLTAEIEADMGAYLYQSTPVPAITAATLMGGVYSLSTARVEMVGLATNRVPTGPYRGAGRPEATYFVERTLDVAARELGLHPMELRRRNLISEGQFPYKTVTGLTYDSGRYGSALDRLEARMGRSVAVAAEHQDVVLGRGCAMYIERAAPGGWESAGAILAEDGRVVLRSGASDHGQGHATSLAQIVVSTLGIPFDQVLVQQGDSDYGDGVGTFGSRSMALGGEAARLAARGLGAKLLELCATLLEADVRDLVNAGDHIFVRGSLGSRVRLSELTRLARNEGILGPSELVSFATRSQVTGPVFPYGAYGAEVALDPETGVVRVRKIIAIDDAGTIINPLLAEGQVMGSTLQGVGSALFEQVIVDEVGQPLTTSLMTYLVPTAPEADYELDSSFLETPTPLTHLGAKGIGESGTIGALAAVSNAVANALWQLGVTGVVHPPFSPDSIWTTIKRSRQAIAGGDD